MVKICVDKKMKTLIFLIILVAGVCFADTVGIDYDGFKEHKWGEKLNKFKDMEHQTTFAPGWDLYTVKGMPPVNFNGFKTYIGYNFYKLFNFI